MTARAQKLAWFTQIARRHRAESRVLVYFLAAVVSLFTLGKAASEIMEGDTLSVDRAILMALRRPGQPDTPIGPEWLHRAMVDLTALGGVTVLTLITALVTIYLLVARKPAIALFTASAVALGATASSLLKMFFIRTRPDVVEHLVGTNSSSFPSAHAMNSAIVYLTLAVLLSRAHTSQLVRLYLISVGIGLTLLIGFTRIYLGVHWPSDVAAGWAVGGLWAVGSSLVAKSFQSRHRIEQATETSGGAADDKAG
jgi:undecaprenyl-diphosphatase